jgi:hypothetical protein
MTRHIERDILEAAIDSAIEKMRRTAGTDAMPENGVERVICHALRAIGAESDAEIGGFVCPSTRH